MSSPAVRKALWIPELLRMIFECSESADIIESACVCKPWSTVALDVLWHDVHDLRALFNALAPIERRIKEDDQTTAYVFSKKPTPAMWSRFEKVYCSRICRLIIGEFSTQYDISRLFKTVAYTRPPRPLLPDLRDLHWSELKSWTSLTDYATLFMHEGVKRLVVSHFGTPDPSVSFFNVVRYRMPQLEHIEIRIYPRSKYAKPLDKCLSFWPESPDHLHWRASDANHLTQMADPAEPPLPW
ncbi:hypothetical protein D9758_010670 [Tetrapyrgos nigripes]|uniref:F-box domain-containing protein n=1 Tax=Tetrapyrgos nigripes TaxID=182062 RepID=A0A8H5GG87_9AGAR|nr:hypothetical protein D9758_010670 [Tetrapyrgos nigripes]